MWFVPHFFQFSFCKRNGHRVRVNCNQFNLIVPRSLLQNDSEVLRRLLKYSEFCDMCAHKTHNNVASAQMLAHFQVGSPSTTHQVLSGSFVTNRSPGPYNKQNKVQHTAGVGLHSVVRQMRIDYPL
jgi:hypothetical protein